ncbi:hypothetical protein IAU59_002425 [Kwoniella sp. CBS 9459]
MYLSTTVLTTLVALGCARAAPLNGGSASVDPLPSGTYSLVPSASASSSPDGSDNSLKVGSILSDLGITLPSELGDKLNDIDLSPYADLNVTAFLGSVGIEITPETTLESLISDVREWKAGGGTAPSLGEFWNSDNNDENHDDDNDEDDESGQDGWGWWGRKHHGGHGHGDHNKSSTATYDAGKPSVTSYFGPGETPVGPSGEFAPSSTSSPEQASTTSYFGPGETPVGPSGEFAPSSTLSSYRPSTTSYFGPGETPIGPSGEFAPSSTSASEQASTTSYFGPGETPVGPSGGFGPSSTSSFEGQVDVGEPTPISTVTDDDVGLPGPTLRV